jgi:energy-coupling factor transporter transmembrane protein EcfT
MTQLTGSTMMLSRENIRVHLGTRAYLSIFLWSLGIMLLVPPQFTPLTAGLCLCMAVLVFPLSIQRLLRWRWLLFMILLAVPPIFFLGALDRSLFGLSYSSEGMLVAIQIALRLIVILVMLDGFTSVVDIVALAGLLERFGLHGLGFSMGVALNLLPALQQSSTNAWHSLRMRGGLRKQRWRGLQLLTMTVVTNALRRAEEIALAAEARAFSPEKSRALPIKYGSWDLPVAIAALLSIFCIALIR